MKRHTLIALLAIPLAACGAPDSKSKNVSSKNQSYENERTNNEPGDQSNNGSANNGASNNGANNGASNNGANNGTSNNGTGSNNETSNNTAGPVCGDGIVDAVEACDGSTDATCESLGFDGGTTSCSDACQIDTSACFRSSCGDGVVQAAETCDDGSSNGDYDACNANCSGLGPHCGDGLLNGAEVCDQLDFGQATCADFGFDGGVLGCDANCGIDTSNCALCGDGVVNGGEVCDDGAMNGTYGNCNALCTGIGAFCGDGVKNGNEACDGNDLAGATCGALGAGRGTPTCTATCQLSSATCSLTPAPGEVIISEIMQNPANDLDNDGEYFEVWNTTSQTRDLDGCVIESSTASGPESFTITASVTIASGGYAVFARNANAPFVADYVYNGAINLNNSVDELAIICPQPNGTFAQIDGVSYDDGATFPDPDGASMNLDPGRFSSSLNDIGLYWCESTSTFGNGDRGTPGTANDACP